MNPLLSRKSLARVVTSLLRSELKAARHGTEVGPKDLIGASRWPDHLPMGGDGSSVLPLDSLDLLRLAAAVNEMFHLGDVGRERDLLSAGTFGQWLDSIEAAWAGGVEQITFMTSGSTGRPKACTHTFAHLQAEVRHLAEMFADRTRIVALTPAHHIFGFLFTAMLPDRLGHHDQTSEPTSDVQMPRGLQRGDLVVTFPERWQWLYRSVARWPEGVGGVVSTAPCPADLIGGLMERGLESLVEVYGSSETAGLATRRWPQTRYRLMPHWQFKNIHPVEGALLAHSSGLQVRLKDHIDLQEDDSFTLAGRVDDAVQVGGINVYPGRVTAMLRDQPGVSDVAVRLGASGRGNRLKAFVVPQPHTDPAELQRQLEEWAVATLDTVERPGSFTFGDKLPKDEMGKDCDW